MLTPLQFCIYLKGAADMIDPHEGLVIKRTAFAPTYVQWRYITDRLKTVRTDSQPSGASTVPAALAGDGDMLKTTWVPVPVSC